LHLTQPYTPVSRKPDPDSWACKQCGTELTNLLQKTSRSNYCEPCKESIVNAYQKNRTYIPLVILPRPCKYCQVVFTPKKSNAEYCNNLCWTRDHRKISRICINCGRLKPKGQHKYCGKTCQLIAWHKNTIIKLEKQR